MAKAIDLLLMNVNVFGIQVQYWMIAFAAFFALWLAYEIALVKRE